MKAGKRSRRAFCLSFSLQSFPHCYSVMQGAANPNPNGDLLLGQPGDTVSAVAWSPVAQQSGNEAVHLLAASCWDGNLLFSRVSTSGQFEATQAAAHKAPILDVAWAMVRGLNSAKKFQSASRLLSTLI